MIAQLLEIVVVSDNLSVEMLNDCFQRQKNILNHIFVLNEQD